MYGHAASTLTPCAYCPAWEPRWAAFRTDDGTPVCTVHAVITIPDLMGAAS